MNGVQTQAQQVRVVSVRVKRPRVRLHVICNSLLVSVAISCVVALVLCGQYIVRPYRKTLAFEETTCTTKKLEWVDKFAKCCRTVDSLEICDEPGDGVVGFPCLLITATFSGKGRNHSAKVFKDDDTWNTNPRCSYPICDAYQYYGDEPNEKGREFAEEYQVGSTYPCYLSPASNHELIININVTRSQMILSMFVPSLVFVICIIAVIVIQKYHVSSNAKEPPYARF